MSILSIYKRHGFDKNDKSFLVGKLVILKPNKYINLDLTWLDI